MFTAMSEDVDQQLSFIFGRRSIRSYTNQAVGPETIRKLLEAAMAAPSAAAKDPWRFVVVQRRTVLAKISEALPHGRMLSSAAAGIVVCGDLEAAHDRQISYLLQDCSAAVQNILLSAHVLGLGACWLGVHPREDRMRALKDILSIKDPVVPVACIAVGYPAETKPARTRFNSEYVRTEA
jgi:nitroreductase